MSEESYSRRRTCLPVARLKFLFARSVLWFSGMELRRRWRSRRCLHGDGSEQFECALLFGVGGGYDLESGRVVLGARGAAGVAHDGREFIEERTKAVRRSAIGQGVGERLALRGRGARCGSGRSAPGLSLLVFLGA